MCVSDHMGLVGRLGFFCNIFVTVPRVRFLFKNKKFFDFCTDVRQSGSIYFLFFIYDPQKKHKKNLSRTMKKTESVGEKRVSRSGDRKHFFCLS